MMNVVYFEFFLVWYLSVLCLAQTFLSECLKVWRFSRQSRSAYGF